MSTIINPIARILDIPVVPYKIWLARLESELRSPLSEKMSSKNPALKLMEFYRANLKKIDESGGAITNKRLAVERTLEMCSTLSDPRLHVLGEDDARRWMAHWAKAGIISG